VFSRVPAGALGDMLEIGSGDGFMASMLAPLGKRLTTTDPAPGAVRHGRELPRVRCSATALPFADASFDFIFSSSVLEHVRERDGAMGELRRCLRPHGVMVHLMPSPTWKLLQLFLYYPHVALSGLERIGPSHQLPAPSEPAAPEAAAAPAAPAPSTEDWRDDGAKPTLWQEIKRGALPQVHGEFNGHVRELIGFRARTWARSFRAAGFAVRGQHKLPLYSGYGFGLERMRRFGEWIGMSAHTAFVVTHPDARVDDHSWWWPCRRHEREQA
jgi:SAM-dependent methyltransferase